MNAHEELNPDRPPQADAEPAEPAASDDGRAEKPANAAESLEAAPTAGEAGEAKPTIEPPRLHLIPYAGPARAEAAGGATAVAKWASGLAAGVALIVAVTGVGLYDHARQSSLLAVKAEESRGLADTVQTLKDRIDAIETARAREDTAELRKVAAELKTQSAAAHDVNGALAQLTARVDRVDHDQSARLDKLADRFDHDSTARIADLATRLDKLEKKPAAAVVAAAPTPPAQTARPAVAAARPDPGVSNEITGSIEKPQAPLRGYFVLEAQDGVAIVDGRDGPRQVTPGDFLPGAGRVQRIERRGREWVVVTSAGFIAADPSRF